MIYRLQDTYDYQLPELPENKEDILFYDLPKKEQYWRISPNRLSVSLESKNLKMIPKNEIIGRRFGRLAVLSEIDKSDRKYKKRRVFLCRCDCGKLKEILLGSLKHTKKPTVSCGCKTIEKTIERSTIHGEARKGNQTTEHSTWYHMIGRCENPKHDFFKDYGARGITVCQRWKESYLDFLADMGRKPSPKHSIDRIDNDKGYHKENCRWATAKQQSGNTRFNRWIEYDSRKMIMSDWAREFGIRAGNLKSLLNRNSIEIIASFYKRNGALNRFNPSQ